MKKIRNSLSNEITSLVKKFAAIELVKANEKQVKGGADIIIEESVDV